MHHNHTAPKWGLSSTWEEFAQSQDAWCSKAQHKHQQWQSGACMRSEQAQTHSETRWQSRSLSFLPKPVCIQHLDYSHPLSCFLCFLYLSNHSRHVQTPTTCCLRHLMLSGGVRSSISGWENTALLILQRQGGQQKKTQNAALPLNKTGDQIAQICAVVEGGLCSAAQKQQGPADTLQGSFIFTSSAPDPALKDLQHWQRWQSHNCLQQITAPLDMKWV